MDKPPVRRDFICQNLFLVKPQFLLLKPAMFTSKTIKNQRPFQEPIYWRYLHVSKASLSGLCKGISPENMALYLTLRYLYFKVLIFPNFHG